MYPLRMESALLLGATLLAGCSERNPPMAPSAGLLAAATSVVGDRPYSWSLTCQSSSKDTYVAIGADWRWTENGVAIVGTETLVTCFPNLTPQRTVSGVALRPASANGFTACVGSDCQSWAFDPAASFGARLNGSSRVFRPGCFDPYNKKCVATVSATLNMQS